MSAWFSRSTSILRGSSGRRYRPCGTPLSSDEKAKLDALDPLIKNPFVENWGYSGLMVTVQDPRHPDTWLAFIDPGAFVADGVERETEYQKKVLMALPAEFPSIEDLVLPEFVAEYQELHPDLKEKFWREVGIAYGMGLTVARPEFGALTETQIREFFSNYVAGWSKYQSMTPKYRNLSQR